MTATVNLAPLPKQRFVDNNGNPLAGGMVFTYAAGTTTKQATYTDSTGSTPNPNPVILDSRGEAPIWLDQTLAYKVTLAPSTDTDPPTAPIWTIDQISSVAGSLFSLTDPTKGSGQVAFNQQLNYVAQTLGATLVDRGVDLMNFITSQTERAAIKAGSSAADHAPFFTAAFVLAKKVYVPQGSWRMLSTVTIPTGCTLEGSGPGSTAISVFGCDGFHVAAGSSLVRISGLTMESFTSGGAADPRLYDAVLCQGVSGNTVNNVTVRDMYLQGWIDGINWQYTWSSRVDNVTTINTNNGVTIVGQSVNNSITGSRLVVNSGNASIQSSQSGSDTPEGLMISDCLLSSGLYGLLVNGSFLSFHISNCVLDLISGYATNTTDCKELRITNSWMYAANGCVNLLALGSASSEGASIVGNVMRVTSTTGTVIQQRGANVGLTVIGNHLIYAGTATGVFLDGQAGLVEGNYLDNSGTGSDVVLNSSQSTHRVGKNTRSDGTPQKVVGGFGTPEYSEGNWTVTDQSGASLTIANNTQATYVKVGKQVTCTLDVTFPATANTSVARLSLPFQPDAGAAPSGQIAIQQPVTFALLPSATTASATFVFWKPASQAFALNSDLTGAHLVVSFTYRANS